ncbi:MAG TPA: AtpZ/AtpI family protein [Planctomycetes bacterium]|nr:AtpZ/AtpI family protein [Planctomycetota bacterium]
MGPKKTKGARKSPLAALAGPQASAGWTFGLSVVVFSLGGYGLDQWLGTSPLFLLVLGFLGAVGGFISLVETVSPGTLFPSRRGGRKKGGQGGDASGTRGKDSDAG